MTGLASHEDVLDQYVDYKASWWTRYVPVDHWPEQLISLPSVRDRAGWQRITRRDLFALADADSTGPGRLGLLLGCYLWGTGPSAFLVGRRARTFTRTPLADVAARLTRVDAIMVREGATAAYASMARGAPNAIAYLGPAFFTKYLYGQVPGRGV